MLSLDHSILSARKAAANADVVRAILGIIVHRSEAIAMSTSAYGCKTLRRGSPRSDRASAANIRMESLHSPATRLLSYSQTLPLFHNLSG